MKGSTLVPLDRNPRRHGITWFFTSPGFLPARDHRRIRHRRSRSVLHRPLRDLHLSPTRTTPALLGTLAQANPIPLDFPRRGEHGSTAADIAVCLRG
jgi:hypothetical protein